MDGKTPYTLKGCLIYLAILLLIFATHNKALAQAHTSRAIMDSMIATFNGATSPALKNKVALAIADYYNEFVHKGDSSLYFAYYVLNHPAAKVRLAQDAEACFNVAHALYSLHQPEKSLTYLDNAYNLSKKCGNTYVEYRCQYFRSVIFQEINEPDSSLKFLQNALAINSKSKNNDDLGGILNDLGRYYYERKDYRKALEYDQKGYQIWKTMGEYHTPGILSDIGNCFFYLGNYDSALAYYTRSFNVNKKIKSSLGLGYCFNNIGLVYFKKGDYDKALDNYSQSLKYYEQEENHQGAANLLDNICKTYLVKKQYYLALRQIDKGLPHALLSRDKTIIYRIYKDMVDIYEQQKKYPLAFKYQKVLTDYRDSIYGTSKAYSDAALKSHISLMQKDAENQVLRSEKELDDVQLLQNKLLSIIIGTFLVITIAALVILIWNVRQRASAMKMLKAQNKIIEEKNAELADLNNKLSYKSEALENLNKFKDKLFSIISHDFRSPLVSLNSFLALLLEIDYPKEAIKQLSEEMIDRVNLTLNFVDNLIEWAQSQIQSNDKVFEDFPAAKIADELIELYAFQAHSKGLDIKNEIPEDLSIHTNTGMFKMILRNLLSNAIKFSDLDDEIVVKAKKEKDKTVFTVQDTGLGMSGETMDIIFSGIIQSTPGTAFEKGNGMGLILCKEFIEKYGGRIWAESKEGHGSSFCFSIPNSSEISKQIAA
jgi:two-component system sensor histidine kinase/response regulator